MNRNVTLAPLVFLQHVGAGDVRRHQVGRELDAFEADVQDFGQRADHQRLGQAGHAFQQAMAARENSGKQLLDHFVLAHDDLLQLLLHDLAMLAELLQNFAQVSLLRRHGDPSSFDVARRPRGGNIT